MKETLEEKRREISSQRRQSVVQSRDNHVIPLAESCDPGGMTTPPQSKGNSPQDTPSHTPSGSIGSRKRRAAFEARTRQLLEDEGEEFRRQREGERNKQQTVRKLDFSLATPKTTTATPPATPPDDPLTTFLPADMIEEGKKLLKVPKADTQWYITSSHEPSHQEKIEGGEAGVKGETDDHAHLDVVGGDFFNEVMTSVEQSVGGAGRERKKRKRVSFSPEAVILTAALEGDLSTLKECVEKVSLVCYSYQD